MKIELGKKYLITSDNWFFGPNGEQYKAVWGTVTSIENDSDLLGIKTNRGSTNWYVVIGNMIIAGCQVHYCIQTDNVNKDAPVKEMVHEGKMFLDNVAFSRIYMAD